MGTVRDLGRDFFQDFSFNAGDLYPGRYTPAVCDYLAELHVEILARAREKNSIVVAHNYLYPECHRSAAFVGDSLGLALKVRDAGATRVDFQSVSFMATTAKMIVGEACDVYTPDRPETLGCSLVFGTDHAWLRHWKELNPGGVLVTYVNSDAATKAMSDYISTSRNTADIIVRAIREHPGKKILVLPDKYLGFVMKTKALEKIIKEAIDVEKPLDEEELTRISDNIEIYTHEVPPWNASCYVHEQIGIDAPERMLEEHADAELMIHPECGCASSCLLKLSQGLLPRARTYFLSTEQMVEQARRSSARTFIVATEKGMIYRLRREMPEKTFLPVSFDAECRFMKANTLEKLLRSLIEDRIKIVLCNDCCDPERPYCDEKELHIQRSVATKAKQAIDRMMAS